MRIKTFFSFPFEIVTVRKTSKIALLKNCQISFEMRQRLPRQNSRKIDDDSRSKVEMDPDQLSVEIVAKFDDEEGKIDALLNYFCYSSRESFFSSLVSH